MVVVWHVECKDDTDWPGYWLTMNVNETSQDFLGRPSRIVVRSSWIVCICPKRRLHTLWINEEAKSRVNQLTQVHLEKWTLNWCVFVCVACVYVCAQSYNKCTASCSVIFDPRLIVVSCPAHWRLKYSCSVRFNLQTSYRSTILKYFSGTISFHDSLLSIWSLSYLY